jgi:hypothetical protein
MRWAAAEGGAAAERKMSERVQEEADEADVLSVEVVMDGSGG